MSEKFRYFPYQANKDILRMLIESGVDYVQGHFIAEPMVAPESIAENPHFVPCEVKA